MVKDMIKPQTGDRRRLPALETPRVSFVGPQERRMRPEPRRNFFEIFAENY
jgi:hypothetical protein